MSTERRQTILEALARELEANPGGKITTAKLAHSLGVSEAALYRHFPSKAKMFEALIEFAEETVFSLITRILNEQTEPVARCRDITTMVLQFVERNPGIARVLHGDILVGEQARLQIRIQQFFDRIETQLRQVLREAQADASQLRRTEVVADANLLTTILVGKLALFVRSGFKIMPTDHWTTQAHEVLTAIIERR